MKRHSFPSIYLKPTPKTKAGRLPLRRHHEAAVEGNHSLASPPAAGNPCKIPWRNPGNPWEEPSEAGKSKAKVPFWARLELQLPTVRQVPQQRAAADKKGPSLLGYGKSHRKLWIEITSYSQTNQGSQSGSSRGGSGKWPFLSTFACLKASSNMPCPHRSVCDYPHVWMHKIWCFSIITLYVGWPCILIYIIIYISVISILIWMICNSWGCQFIWGTPQIGAGGLCTSPGSLLLYTKVTGLLGESSDLTGS